MLSHKAKIFLFFSLLMVSSAAAQQIVDRIVAVVDDEIILQSELEQALQLEISQRLATGAQKEQLRKQLLEAMINDKVLLIKAKRDSIVVTEKEVDDALQEQLDKIKDQMGSEQEYEKLLAREGITERELRRRYRVQIRNYLLKQKVMASLGGQIVISYKDVVDFYNTHIDSLPLRPQMVNLSQIFLRLPNHEDEIYQKLSELLQRVRHGEDFAQLAKKYSEDPGSAELGGDLGFFSPGTMLPEFEKAAFSLKLGEVSDVVRTSAGYHIIKLEEKKGDRIRVRHILIRVGPTTADVRAAAAKLETLRTRALNGENFSELAQRYSMDTQSAGQGGLLGWFSVDQLPPAFKQAISKLKVGQISSPIRTDSGMCILRLNENQPQRPLDLEKDRDLLENMLRQEKLRQAFDRMIDSLKHRIYIDIRDE